MKKTTLILFLTISALLSACNEEPKATVIPVKQEECKHDTIIVHDTVYFKPELVKKKLVNKPKATKKSSIKIDTLAIIENYKATLKSEGITKALDSVTYNVYMFKKWNLNTNVYVFPEIKKNQSKRGFYAGFGTTINQNVFNSIYVGGLYKTKRDEIIKLDVGFANDGSGNFQPFIGTGIYFKIK